VAAFFKEDKLKRFVCVSLEPRPRRLDVEILPLTHFLEALWAGEYT
jgi:hypothetical protein